jgi:hypothetical protein
MNTFTQIPQFPKYEVNKLGQVRNAKTQRVLKPSYNKGYQRVVLHGKTMGVHRLVMFTFKPQEGMEKLHVNHINGIKDDNRPENLEFCTLSQNSSLPKFKPGKGILKFPYSGKKKFRVTFKYQGQVITVGYYKTYEEAETAYNKAHLERHGVLPNQPVSIHSKKKAS